MISSRFPWPKYKGGYNLRILEFSRILKKNYCLDLLTLIRDRKEENEIEELKKENIFKNIFFFKHSRFKEYINTFIGIFSNLPLQVNYYYSKPAVKWLKENFKKYDLLYLNTVRTVKWVNHFKIKKVIDLIDAVSLNYLEGRRRGFGFWKIITKIEIPRLINFERNLFLQNLFEKYFITTSFDKEYLEKITKKELKNLTVIPIGAKEEIFSKAKELKDIKEENIITFFGKMDTQPNQDAVLFFSRKIFPFLKKDIPDLKFYIIGIEPSKIIKDLEKIKGIKVTGYLKDPYSLLLKTKIIVAPMRFGAGIQNKILDGMSLGKTVIASKICARGIKEAESGKQLEIIDSFNPSVWIEKIKEIINDSQKRKQIGKEAKELIEKNYRWKIIEEKLLTEIKKIVE